MTSGGWSGWRVALRIARREAARHWLATGLAVLLVALPVAAAVGASTLSSSLGDSSDNGSYSRMGTADAKIRVTPHEKVTVRYRERGGWMTVRPADKDRRPARKPATVDLAALLPDGTRLVPFPGSSRVRLGTGGSGQLRMMDFDEPMTRPFAEVVGGRAPEQPDEVAISPAAGSALQFTDSTGDLRADADLMVDGRPLRVVGLAEGRTSFYYAPPIYVPRGSVLNQDGGTASFLADLPELTNKRMQSMRDQLADQGVAVLFRDAAQHPDHWPELARKRPPGPVDAEALAIGALVVGFGLVEIVLLVGAALAVGARRQIRSLGLLASTGGSPADVRRVVLARGLLVGMGGSVLGAATVLAAMQLALPWRFDTMQDTLFVLDANWPNVAAIVAVGTVGGVLAAAYPAWVVGKMTAVDALAERFPSGRRPARGHPVAVTLVAAGALGVLGAGRWIAAEYAPRAGGRPSSLPVLGGGAALLVLLAGLIWLTPVLVQRAGGLSRRLGLSGRLALRDATRHRQRTAAAVIGLTVTVAGSAFAGFGLDAALAREASARTCLRTRQRCSYRAATAASPSQRAARRAAVSPGSCRQLPCPRSGSRLPPVPGGSARRRPSGWTWRFAPAPCSWTSRAGSAPTISRR